MFQAWLVKMANIATNSAPSTLPGARERKNTLVIEMKPKMGTDWRMSRIGTRSLPARSLFAAQVAYVSVNTSEQNSATSMRNVVRAAYSGRCDGFKESGTTSIWVSGANRPRAVSPRKAMRPMTTMNASTSQRDARPRRKT